MFRGVVSRVNYVSSGVRDGCRESYRRYFRFTFSDPLLSVLWYPLDAVASPFHPRFRLTIGLGVEFLVFYNLCGGRHLLRTDSDETIIRKSCDKHRDLPKPSRMNKE